MYKEFYGFTTYPFALTPDPQFHYLSANHETCLLHLLSGLEREYGILVLTGNIGTGKTILLHRLVQNLGKETYVAFLSYSSLNSVEILQYTYHEFGLGISGSSKGELLIYLKDFIAQYSNTKGRFVIIIDEAQNLSPDVLEDLRLLTNFETAEKKIIQIVLAGQENLEDILQAKELDQLRQRIGIYCRLVPMNFHETENYIAKRLSIAGAKHNIFTPKAIETIFLYSQGIPRVINLICDLALFAGGTEGTREVGPAIIKRVAENLHLSAHREPVRSGMAPGPNTGGAYTSDVASSPETMPPESSTASSNPARLEQLEQRPGQRAIFEHLISQKMQEQAQIGQHLRQRSARTSHRLMVKIGLVFLGLIATCLTLYSALPGRKPGEYATRAIPAPHVGLPPGPAYREPPLLPPGPAYREPPLLPPGPAYRPLPQQVQWAQSSVSYQLPVGTPLTVPLPLLQPALDSVAVTVSVETSASMPGWLTFDPATLTLSGTAPPAEMGKTYHLTFRAQVDNDLASLLHLVVILIAQPNP